MESCVLILDLNSSPCAAGKCTTLATLLRSSLPLAQIHYHKDSGLVLQLMLTPDLIVVRASLSAVVRNIIGDCKRKWPSSPLLAIYCCQLEPAIDDHRILGCDDFSYCPFHDNELLDRVHRLIENGRAASLNIESRTGAAVEGFGALIGKSDKFLHVVRTIAPLAQANAAVLICGETGTGKELFSRAIHYHSARRHKPFIPLNCAALPDHLFENELFGHLKGAYTDASSAEKGLIAEAEGGTLFLDEVDALSLAAQSKLLRMLQNGEYRPLGSSKTMTANVRIIAATNADLRERIKTQSFREDLYYRLNALTLVVPPLRERIEDVVQLTTHFLAQYAKQHDQEPRQISENALRKLMAYGWPGNVRELEAVILRTVVLRNGPTLQADDIDIDAVASQPPTLCPGTLQQEKTAIVRNFERRYLQQTLAAHSGNISQAAKAAGKERRSFQRLLQKHAIDRRSFC